MRFVSEEAAKEMWCPMFRGPTSVGGEGGGNTINGGHPFCIASGCMMWRWRVVTIDGLTGMQVTSRQMDDIIRALPVPPTAGEREAQRAKTQERFRPQWGKVGYCGMAGKPE